MAEPAELTSNESSTFKDAYNCTDTSAVICCHRFFTIARTLNNKLWSEYRKSEVSGADLYKIVILGLFASIIILLMFRSIKWNESLDDQVTTLLSSMQMRVDHEDNIRNKKKMKEAKQRAQLWLAELKSKSVNKLTKRQRSASFYDSAIDFADLWICINGQTFVFTTNNNLIPIMRLRFFETVRPRETSVCSVPTSIPSFSLKVPTRATSHNGTLPAIIVQDEMTLEELSMTSRPTSRESSTYSDFQSDCSFDQEVFRLLLKEQDKV